MQYPILNNPTEDTVIFYNVDTELEAKVRNHEPTYNSMMNTIEAFVKAQGKGDYSIPTVARLVCEYYKQTKKLYRSGFIQSVIDTILCQQNEGYYHAYIDNQIMKAEMVYPSTHECNPSGYQLKHSMCQVDSVYEAFK